MNKNRLRKEPLEFSQLRLRDQWRMHGVKQSLNSFLKRCQYYKGE